MWIILMPQIENENLYFTSVNFDITYRNKCVDDRQGAHTPTVPFNK